MLGAGLDAGMLAHGSAMCPLFLPALPANQFMFKNSHFQKNTQA